MDEGMENKNYKLRYWHILLLVLGFVFLVAIAIPSSLPGPRVIPINKIINNLRLIDAAKNQWALEHDITNHNQILALTNQPSEQDLIPYLNSQNGQTGFVHSS